MRKTKNERIAEGNRLIGNYMGKNFADPLNYMYDKRWDQLMPVLKKFCKWAEGSGDFWKSIKKELEDAVITFNRTKVYKLLVTALKIRNKEKW